MRQSSRKLARAKKSPTLDWAGGNSFAAFGWSAVGGKPQLLKVV
ncbi:hypothetical protein [Paenibacillus pasadenensis]|nr:hypothetical protein [Paenibacillus pasadenensis]